MNACKMRIVREGVEYKCVTEDTKTRVYVSIMRKQDEEKLRKELNARKRRRTKKKIRKFLKEMALPCLINIGIDISKLVFGVGAGLLTYLKLSAKLRVIRGYDALGGELILACMIAAVAYYVADRCLEGWKVE